MVKRTITSATKDILKTISSWEEQGRPLLCDDCGEKAEFIMRHGESPFAWWPQCKEHAEYVELGKRAPRYYIQTLDGKSVESVHS